ncbi:MAG TPA: hypothetical protein VF648_05840 [Pyrinomonadaceae bacterium]|jgi:hypothetical protein
MSKISKQNDTLKNLLLLLVKFCLPFILAFALTVCLTAVGKMRWTISLCSSFLLIGLALLTKPIIEMLWLKAKTLKTTANQPKRRFVER